MTTSILDNDLYKFTTSYAYMKMFPQATGTFKFYDRNHTKYTKEEVAKIIQRVWHLQNLALTDEEANFMKNACYFIPTYYFDWLKSFRFNPKQLRLQGIIIGIEDCNSFCDYYYIVYVPESKQVTYELANSADFVKTIKI